MGSNGWCFVRHLLVEEDFGFGYFDDYCMSASCKFPRLFLWFLGISTVYNKVLFRVEFLACFVEEDMRSLGISKRFK